ncbi:hypothetical protein CPB83DRAFT_840396 [Crepidotus variabilis]|uniref:Uncharacterized protein n=1 Tax=Crepidotus variabilis TaxID=179855 RepID=A0A9P6JJ54_9AGAR|nr:hypothetical protein CPB83DRAFT_840396 [Crepidotus variabilis]
MFTTTLDSGRRLDLDRALGTIRNQMSNFWDDEQDIDELGFEAFDTKFETLEVALGTKQAEAEGNEKKSNKLSSPMSNTATLRDFKAVWTIGYDCPVRNEKRGAATNSTLTEVKRGALLRISRKKMVLMDKIWRVVSRLKLNAVFEIAPCSEMWIGDESGSFGLPREKAQSGGFGPDRGGKARRIMKDKRGVPSSSL